MSMLVSLISDLRHMINSYYRRFPDANAPASNTTSVPQPVVQAPVTQPPPMVQKVHTPKIITIRDDFAESEQEDQTEEGEILQDDPVDDEWDQYIVPTSPSPSPSPASSPPEDIGDFHDLMERASKRFDLPLPVKENECFLYDFKVTSGKSIRTIPIIDHIWEEGLKLMKNPASVAASVPRIEKKYRAPETSPACLIGHPRPEPVVMQAVQRRFKNPASACSVPPDKEGKKMDGAGKRFAVMAAASIKATSALALISQYNRQMWADIAPLLSHLPDDKKEEAANILQDGTRTASESIDIAMDIASVGF